MNVGELIQLLERFAPNRRVMVDGYEFGAQDLTPDGVRECLVAIEYHGRNAAYGGDHEEIHRDDLPDLQKDWSPYFEHTKEQCVLISRKD